MLIDFTRNVFNAQTRTRSESDILRSAGGWRWHDAECNPRFCKPECPARHVQRAWWTLSTAVAARITGEGVHTPASLAAIEGRPPAPSITITARNGAFFATTENRVQSDALRESAENVGAAWRWHGGECDPRYCRPNCVATDHRGLWTTDEGAARAAARYLDDSARAELGRRSGSVALSHAASASETDFGVPAPLGRAYLPFQLAAIRYALDRRSTLVGDAPGLGKTVTAVGVVNASPNLRTMVVVAPAFLREVWRRHIVDWSARPTRVVVLESAEDARRAVARNALTRREGEVLWVVVSYGGARIASPVGQLLATLPTIDMLVIDEAHRIKERKAQQSQGVLALGHRAGKVLALTGTPIPNRPVEMATTLELVQPGFSFSRFATRFCDAHATKFNAFDCSGASNLDELQRELRSTCMIRRLKQEVLKELPPKRWQVIVLPSDGIPARLLKAPKPARSLRKKAAENADAIARLEAARLLAQATGDQGALAAAVEDELVARGVDFDSASHDRVELGIAKVPAILGYLEATEDETNRPAIIFAHHREVAARLFAELGGDARAVFLDGGVSMRERTARVDRFQTSASLRYLVATIESAKEGLTITRASRVVFAEQTWTPGVLVQAEDRAHRIGQTETVDIEYLVIDGTLDVYMAQLLAEKRRIAEAALDHGGAPTREIAPAEIGAVPATFAAVAHDPDAIVQRAIRKRDETIRETESPEQYAQRTAQRRGVRATIEPTAGEIAASIEGMRALSDLDPDKALVENSEGFSKADVYVGHALAKLSALTPELWALAAILCRKYRGQLGDELVTRTGVARL